MTEQQREAANQIRAIATQSGLLIPAIWCASDVASYFNDNNNDDEVEQMTLDEAEELLFGWEKQFEENAITQGYNIMGMMLLENDLDETDETE